MSNEHKLNWLTVIVLIVLLASISYTAGASLRRSLLNEDHGIKCVSKCQNFDEMLESLK